ncbi:PREDICTED: coagulation factor IX-like [Priapulus caudatus]|uniref:Coagulation factor IX-like n=1 Tax=Priapulus caudatus TaxID=37621 RepID=A0ABM1ETB7_PRICU|nr:PREDICTED: coagulation factor IX-like [Priapulus caudatus]
MIYCVEMTARLAGMLLLAVALADCGPTLSTPTTPPTTTESVKRPIVLGDPVSAAGTWPWQALVLNEGNVHCGGSLINPCHVLTAKHCVQGRDPTKLAVVMGEHQRSVAEGREQTRKVIRFIQHPSWDLAILQLEQSFTINQFVKPVDLATVEPTIHSQTIVTGWGQIDPNTVIGGRLADTLQFLRIPVVDKSRCIAEGIAVSSEQLCAGKYLQLYANACYGDSGGPLVQRRQGKYQQVGVVQGGKAGCPDNSHYAVYVSVPQAYSWIKQQVPTTTIQPPQGGTTLFGLVSRFAALDRTSSLYSITQKC